MASPYVLLNRAIWNDEDFRALSAQEQHLYLLLWTAPKGSHAGVNDWLPERIAARSADLTPSRVEEIAAGLAAKHFIVIDAETKEVLIRSYTRFDRTLENVKHAISFVKAYADVESPKLRAAIAYEVGKIQRLNPGFKCWSDERVQGVLLDTAVSAKALPLGMAEAIPMPMGEGTGKGMPTTATTTTTTTTTTPPKIDVPEQRKAPTAAAAAGSDRFDEFWNAYPRKVSKTAARKAFAKALKTTPPETVVAGARALARRVVGKELQYVPHAATWLNQERWDDPDEAVQQQQTVDEVQFREEVATQARSPRVEWLEDVPSGLTLAQEREWDIAYRARLREKAAVVVRERWDRRAEVGE